MCMPSPRQVRSLSRSTWGPTGTCGSTNGRSSRPTEPSLKHIFTQGTIRFCISVQTVLLNLTHSTLNVLHFYCFVFQVIKYWLFLPNQTGLTTATTMSSWSTSTCWRTAPAPSSTIWWHLLSVLESFRTFFNYFFVKGSGLVTKNVNMIDFKIA